MKDATAKAEEAGVATIQVTDRSGQDITIDIVPGTTLMQAITDEGVADLLALCGGVCSCATCHVYLEGDGVELLPPASDDEKALLEFSSHCRETSRLSCQVRLTENLNGLRATIAPED